MLKDNRYEGVIHLVTAADGAAEFYESESNEARYDTIETAKIQDEKLRRAYLGHQKWIMIENKPNQSFNEKINRAKEAVHRILAIPTCATFYKKFLLKKQNVKRVSDDGLSIPLDLS
jgi:tyrosyl-tRNA synthetase